MARDRHAFDSELSRRLYRMKGRADDHTGDAGAIGWEGWKFGSLSFPHPGGQFAILNEDAAGKVTVRQFDSEKEFEFVWKKRDQDYDRFMRLHS